MKRRLACLCLVLLLSLAACGQIPTPGEGALAYPPPPLPTQTADASTPVVTPDRATHPPMEYVDLPVYANRCTPTPGEAEHAAVLAQGLPASIEFELQRAIYLARQQGIPNRPAKIVLRFDPAVLTITGALALAEQHGAKIQAGFEQYSGLYAVIPLDALPGLAAELGIVSLELEAGVYGGRPCSTPGGPTSIPITHPPGKPPL